MRLAKYSIIIFGLGSLLLSCAQLGTIDGGVKDTTAPQIIQSTTKNGSTNFNKNTIEFQFDEYFQLSNPQTSITIAPNHTRIKSTNVGKKLQVQFLDSLHANTTYQLLFNSAIKDINEGNDSLMVFVFSTGNTLDSAYYQTKIIDAFTAQPVKKLFLGLFDSLERAPKYLQKTNDQGMAVFSFIKPGKYEVMSWEDINSNAIYDSTERVAFRTEELIIKDSIIDTIPLRLAKPEFQKSIRTATFIDPGLVGVALNNHMVTDKFYFQNEAIIKKDELFWVGKDSLLLPFNSIKTPSTKLYLQHENGALDSIKIVSTSEEVKSLKIADIKLKYNYKDYAEMINECKSKAELVEILDNVKNEEWKSYLEHGIKTKKILSNVTEAASHYNERNNYQSIILQIRNTFEIDNFYSNADIKGKLTVIYNDKGLNKKAKATDIYEFAEVKSKKKEIEEKKQL